MLVDILGIIGVIACSVTGALAAGRVRMDYFGVLIISFVTSLGGGTIRDVTLGNYPLAWIKDQNLLYISIISCFLTIITARYMKYLKTIFLVLDAIGLVSFAMGGVLIALNLGHGMTVACVAAVATGAFGGVLRDLLCNRIPLAFQHELYASIAIMIAIMYVSLIRLGVHSDVATILTIIMGMTVRLLAIRFKLSLRVFDYDEDKYTNVAWLERFPKPGLRKFLRREAKLQPQDATMPSDTYASRSHEMTPLDIAPVEIIADNKVVAQETKIITQVDPVLDEAHLRAVMGEPVAEEYVPSEQLAAPEATPLSAVSTSTAPTTSTAPAVQDEVVNQATPATPSHSTMTANGEALDANNPEQFQAGAYVDSPAMQTVNSEPATSNTATIHASVVELNALTTTTPDTAQLQQELAHETQELVEQALNSTYTTPEQQLLIQHTLAESQEIILQTLAVRGITLADLQDSELRVVDVVPELASVIQQEILENLQGKGLHQMLHAQYSPSASTASPTTAPLATSQTLEAPMTAPPTSQVATTQTAPTSSASSDEPEYRSA